MDAITAEHISEFVASLQSDQWKVSSINSALRAIRRVFRLAPKWGLPDTD
jgi:site-specific recombinase XerD